jgi:hypothetical protein
LDTGRVGLFLHRLDRVGVNVQHLYALLENESTPLMTNVILQTYEGRTTDQLGEVKVTEIWRNYVNRKFEDEKHKRELAASEMPYMTEPTKKWLKWLAEQLHHHTRDQHRFFIEEIQPTWLSRTGQIWFYLFSFLSLLLISSAVVQFTFRSAVPIFYGSQATENFLREFTTISAPLGSLWIVSIVWILSRRSSSYLGPVFFGLLTGVVFGSMIWIPYRNMPALALVGGSITAIIVMILMRAVIRILGFSDADIVCVKSRRWNWVKAASGLLVGLAFVTVIGLVSDVTRSIFLDHLGILTAFGKAFTLNTIVWWNWGLPGILSLSIFLFFVLGRGWGTVVLRSEVDKPNQGIIDSGRTGLFIATIGLVTGLVFSLGIGLPCFFGVGWKISSGSCIRGDLTSLLSGIGFGIGYGLALGLVFGLIFGGFAWFQHYLVRLLLNLDPRRIPWRLVKFLRFACKLNLLRRVGGGYEFIDQDLQAYFEEY